MRSDELRLTKSRMCTLLYMIVRCIWLYTVNE